MARRKRRTTRARTGRTASGRIKKGFRLLKGGRVVKARRKVRRKATRRRRR